MTAAAIRPPAARSSAMSRIGRYRWYLPAVAVFVGTIALWEFAVANIDIAGFPLPAPSEIATALTNNWSSGRWPLGKAALATLFEAMGGLDKLIETLKKRLAEQKGRHQGGNKWIGTGGTSPFGAYGYNPEGVRIGQDENRNFRAVKVWD